MTVFMYPVHFAVANHHVSVGHHITGGRAYIVQRFAVLP